MALLQWRDEFSVGDPAVDHEHRELIEQVNAAATAIAEGRDAAEIDAAFGDLLRGVSSHFAHEEKQMRRAHYDHTEEHKEDHERLIDALRDIMDECEAGSGEVPEETVAEMIGVLEEWFTGHFATHDARLHRILGPHEHD